MRVLQSNTYQSISFSLIVLLSLFTALDALAIDIYLPAFPMLADSLQISARQVQQTLSIFLIGLAIGQGIYGPLLDRYGRKIPLLFGTIIFIFGSLLAAMSETLEWLLFARLLQALGASAGLVVPRAIISDLCDAQEAAKNFSILMQVMMIMPILAPILGSYLLFFGSWHIIFYVLAALATVILVFGFYMVPETLNVEHRQPLQIKSILNNYKTLCLNRAYISYTIASGFLLGGFFVYISNAPYIFIQHYQLNEQQFSYLFAANAIGFIILGQLSIFLLKHFSTKAILNLGVISFIALSTILGLSTYLFELNIWQYGLLLGTIIWSTGLMFGNLTALIMQQSEPQLAGSASSLMGLIQYFIGALIGFIVSIFSANIQILPIVLLLTGTLIWISCKYAQSVNTAQQESSPV